MQEFLFSAFISALLIAASIFIFYEILRAAWIAKERLSHRPRSLIYFLVVAIFIAHTLCVWLYGATLWLLATHIEGGLYHTGNIGAPEITDLLSFIYFSVTCYSSLGFGDIVATGPLRMIAGVEAINGLLLIGWSVTYTYFATERYYQHHLEKSGKNK